MRRVKAKIKMSCTAIAIIYLDDNNNIQDVEDIEEIQDIEDVEEINLIDR